jgi:hypothetical protein
VSDAGARSRRKEEEFAARVHEHEARKAEARKAVERVAKRAQSIERGIRGDPAQAARTALLFGAAAGLHYIRIGLDIWNTPYDQDDAVAPIITNVGFGVEGLLKLALFSLHPANERQQHHKLDRLDNALWSAVNRSAHDPDEPHFSNADRTWRKRNHAVLQRFLMCAGQFGEGGRFADCDAVNERLMRNPYAVWPDPAHDFMLLAIDVDGFDPAEAAYRRTHDGETSRLQALIVEYVLLLGRVLTRHYAGIDELGAVFARFSQWATDRGIRATVPRAGRHSG